MNPYLKSYVRLTEFLGQVLGPDYEVVLHDVSNMNHSIIAIANGDVSERKTGGPLTSKALQIIKSQCYKDTDYMTNYVGASSSGKCLRSSTFFIKDGEELVGLLCINFDDSRFKELKDKILGLCHPDEYIHENPSIFPDNDNENSSKPLIEEELFDSIVKTIDDTVRKEMEKIGLPAEDLTSKDRLQIIENLEKDGVFYLKNAVKVVAKALHCSVPTVYRYRKSICGSSETKR